VKYVYYIYKNGTVIDINTRTVVTTSGSIGFELYINDLMKRTQVTNVAYTINGVSRLFFVHEYSGRVLEGDKEICATGGDACLEAWLNA
jgi:hypothetical protein